MSRLTALPVAAFRFDIDVQTLTVKTQSHPGARWVKHVYDSELAMWKQVQLLSSLWSDTLGAKDAA